MMRILLTLTLILCTSLADAATLYVNNSGSPACSDATAKASNSAASPWCTILRAANGSTTPTSPDTAQAASAGDTVLITAGTYSEDGLTVAQGATRFTVALNPANSGTAGNPITFRGVGTVEIRLNLNARGAMIGCSARNYIIWDHFTVNEFYGGGLPDTAGPVGFFANSNFCQLLNSTVLGATTSYFHGYTPYVNDNHRTVAFEDANDITVKNNNISRVMEGDGDQGQNEGCIGPMYDSSRNIIEHNEIHDCGVGIFVKGAHAPEVQEQNIIRYNYIYDCLIGIRTIGADDTLVYQNIIANGKTGESTGLWIGFSTAARSKFINNTIYNTYRNVTIQGMDLVGIELHNNLSVSATTYGIEHFGSGASVGDLNVSYTRNWYYNNPTHFSSQGFGSVNFATWQGTHLKDVNGVNGTDPQFTNAAGGNFHIANATALVTGRVVESVGGTNGATIPVGAYISGTETIGIEVASSTGGAAATGGITFSGSVRIQ